MKPLLAPYGMQPHIFLCDMLPQCPNWMEAFAPSLWIASVSFLRSGTISSRIHNWRSNDSPLWQTLVPHLDFAFASAPQEDEALRLKMKAIVARGAGVVIVTLGENGSIAWDGAQFWRQAPEPVTVIDTMGAGDSFIAGFLCGWSAGMTLPQAMAQGTACAAKTIQYHGAW